MTPRQKWRHYWREWRLWLKGADLDPCFPFPGWESRLGGVGRWGGACFGRTADKLAAIKWEAVQLGVTASCLTPLPLYRRSWEQGNHGFAVDYLGRHGVSHCSDPAWEEARGRYLRANRAMPV